MLVLFASVQPDPKVFADAINLLTFYLYNNTTLQGADRVKVKSFLFQFLHEFFFLPRYDPEQNHLQYICVLRVPPWVCSNLLRALQTVRV